MKSRFEVFFNHMTVRYCSVIVVATPLWGTQGFFFLGCRRKRHKLVLFSRLCTNKLHDDQLSKRQIVQTKHANLNLFVSQHMRGIPGNNSRHGEENNQSPSRVSSQEIVPLFSIKPVLYSSARRQLSLISFPFFNISRGVKELFPVLLH